MEFCCRSLLGPGSTSMWESELLDYHLCIVLMMSEVRSMLYIAVG